MHAFERLEREIRDLMVTKEEKSFPEAKEAGQMEWTDPKIGLIELIYALREQGAFNHGKADLKKIVEGFEKSFCVTLGNTSKSFQEILSRKTGYSIYMDRLKEKLIGRINDIDDPNWKK